MRDRGDEGSKWLLLEASGSTHVLSQRLPIPTMASFRRKPEPSAFARSTLVQKCLKMASFQRKLESSAFAFSTAL